MGHFVKFGGPVVVQRSAYEATDGDGQIMLNVRPQIRLRNARVNIMRLLMVIAVVARGGVLLFHFRIAYHMPGRPSGKRSVQTGRSSWVRAITRRISPAVWAQSMR